MLYKALLLSAVCLALSHTQAHNFALNKVSVEVWALVCGQEQAPKRGYENNLKDVYCKT